MIKKIVTTDEDYLNSLNAEQRAAATALEGPVLVLAGPGTGKTHLLSLRSAHIIRTRSAAPENILILSFTNSAAKAMKERLVKILGSDGYNIETATFHSFANAILLESEEAANHIQEKIQITDIEKVQVLEYILDRTEDIDAIRPFRARYFYLREIERRLGDLKKEGITPAKLAEYLASLAPADTTLTEKQQERLKALAKVYTLYEECKSGIHADIFDKRGRYDFDDMIMVARDVLRCERGLRASLRQRYSHIMVDEYQDTNGAQMDLLFELIDETCPNICCVGDDDQSIYRFQGASINNFSIFKKRFPAATVITLKDNYRSTEDIIRLSGRIIGQIPSAERVAAKTLNAKKEFSQRSILFHEFTTDSEELLYLTQKIEELKTQIASTAELSDAERAAPYNNIAVLVRKRRDISRLIDAFLRAGIPYSTDGKEDISAQVRVRQMIDALRLAHLKDPTDAADRDAILYRILTSDYTQVRFTDLLRLIGLVKTRKREARERGASGEITLVSTFLGEFPAAGDKEVPEPDETARLAIMAQVAFEDPGALHRAAWAIERLLGDAQDRPVHDILLRYIDDA
ncbi:MAG: ATP-dependent helicase, partial [Candidatus Omnitrophota bacterium]